ncbi:MAG: nucleotide exchange factor GrpE [Candidatus Orphnella occulta]|nr:nucleotide exchange factor GrpE [Candidatus Orphnella occulta]
MTIKNKAKNKKQDIKDLEAELKVLREELAKKDDYQDVALRLQAEFDNFRKRSAKERQEFIKYANEGLILELVGILDNFERSIKAADQKQDFKLLHQGVDMISKQLHKLLQEKGLKRIECVGEKFDPVRHEAIEVVESDDAEESKVLEELQAGYMLNEHVLRPAMVKVVKNKPEIVEEEVKPKDEEDYVSQEAPEEIEIEPDEYDESDE